MFSRHQHSKMITNSLFMIFFFYILLAVLTKGFNDLLIPGWKAQHILFIPIILGYLGFCWGVFNLSYDPLVAWINVKKSVYFLLAGTGSLFLAVLIMIISEVFQNQGIVVYVLTLIGIILYILAGPLFAIGFFLFRKDLKTHYFKKYISKFPTIYIVISYLIQSLGIIIFLISGYLGRVVESVSISYLIQSLGSIFLISGYLVSVVGSVFVIAGIVTVTISIIILALGFYPLFISFRTYPKLLEAIEEAQLNKAQDTSKQSKKAS